MYKIFSSIINLIFLILFSILFGIALIFSCIIIFIWGVLSGSPSTIKEFFENLKFRLFKGE